MAQINIDYDMVDELQRALAQGRIELDDLSGRLSSGATNNIAESLRGTKTGAAFTERVTQAQKELNELSEALDNLGVCMQQFKNSFAENDSAQASALGGA